MRKVTAETARTRAELSARLILVRRQLREKSDKPRLNLEREARRLQDKLNAIDAAVDAHLPRPAPASRVPARRGPRTVFDPSKLVPELKCNRPR